MARKVTPRTPSRAKAPKPKPKPLSGAKPSSLRAAKGTGLKVAVLPAAKVAAKAKAKPAGKTKAKGAIRPWTPEEVTEAFRRFAAANAEPRGELQYVNPFTLLVAVVLSAQATDAGVNKATPALFAAADTPEKMVALGEEKV